MTKEYEDFLAHYGVKGQRWGDRKYQNDDGTLTALGREHYGLTDGHRGEKTRPHLEKPEYLKKREPQTNVGRFLKKIDEAFRSGRRSVKGKMGSKKDSRNWDKDDPRNLSDEELNKRNSRLQREQQYEQMTKPKTSEKNKMLSDAMKKIFVGTAVATLASVMAANYKKVIPFMQKTANRLVSKIKLKNSITSNSSAQEFKYSSPTRLRKDTRISENLFYLNRSHKK